MLTLEQMIVELGGVTIQKRGPNATLLWEASRSGIFEYGPSPFWAVRNLYRTVQDAEQD